jgi:hypothetical protein
MRLQNSTTIKTLIKRAPEKTVQKLDAETGQSVRLRIVLITTQLNNALNSLLAGSEILVSSSILLSLVNLVIFAQDQIVCTNIQE